MDFESLKNNIIDVIKEEQIKLGFREETIRLYYPMDSLNSLLDAKMSINQLLNALEQFCLYVKECFGEVQYSRNDKRFCIVIPPKGVSYVHKEVKDRIFLKEFIEKISTCHCNIEDIKAIFQRYSDKVKCSKVTHGEFDYLLYFEDGKPDRYIYCIKFEGCHTIYHRFTQADYNSFGFSQE